MVGFTLSTSPFVYDPVHAASMLITEDALHSPKELRAKFEHEPALVLNQHHPVFWSPKRDPMASLLWIAGKRDAVVSDVDARESAAIYSAAFESVPDSGHNMMMESQTAKLHWRLINGWARSAWENPKRPLIDGLVTAVSSRIADPQPIKMLRTCSDVRFWEAAPQRREIERKAAMSRLLHI